MPNKTSHPTTLEDFLTETKLCCYTCSYPLKGLKSDTCPECGSKLSLEMFTGWGAYVHKARAAMTIAIPIGAGMKAIQDLVLAIGMIWVTTTLPTSLQWQAWPFLAIWVLPFVINTTLFAISLIQRDRIRHLPPSRFWTIHIVLLFWLVGHGYLQSLVTNSIQQP